MCLWKACREAIKQLLKPGTRAISSSPNQNRLHAILCRFIIRFSTTVFWCRTFAEEPPKKVLTYLKPHELPEALTNLKTPHHTQEPEQPHIGHSLVHRSPLQTPAQYVVTPTLRPCSSPTSKPRQPGPSNLQERIQFLFNISGNLVNREARNRQPGVAGSQGPRLSPGGSEAL